MSNPKPFIDMEEYQKKKCQWELLKPGEKPKMADPHIHEPYYKPRKICEGIYEAIGNTPMVKLQNIPKAEGLKCEVLVKCEYLNPGGSAKDRIARRMILDAEKQGRIKPYDNNTIIEATSGNTGLGLALVAAVKKYNMIITLPEKMSQEKSDTLNALGAKIVRTPTEANFWDETSHASVARKIQQSIPNSVILDQYCNPSNPMAHYDQTAEEIWDQCDGKLDVCVISAGTGGTLMGIARKLKEKNPNIKIVAVDPFGSVLAVPESLNKTDVTVYKVEGIGYDFIPKTCERNSKIVDQWIKTGDVESFKMARRLIQEEGLLVGGSSGSTMYAALQVAKTLQEGQRMVVICVDGVRNYMSKFLNDDWMYENGFLDEKAYTDKYFDSETLSHMDTKGKVSDLPLEKAETVIISKTTVKEVLKLFKEKKTECIVALNDKEELVGLLTQRQVTVLLTTGRLTLDSNVAKAVIKDVRKVKLDDPMYYLSKGFARYQYVIVLDSNNAKDFRICEHEVYLNAYLEHNNVQI